ncbi:hypothetical protein AK812_SmicGene27239 [Symbiodinium microadriaticum]|uniref:Uncharacterized protein n=1 Tax=Symbiodinium microadriaticum TaxID=2951 RepID=A0A1Q9D7C5_SYMMI|nr:hypothetical protein AK812_SmicGene27239 [Symbiodinium microadriaticum]
MASRRIPSLSPPCLKTVTQKLLACECRDSWQQPPILLPGSPSSRVPFASLAAFTPKIEDGSSWKLDEKKYRSKILTTPPDLLAN